MNLLLDKFKEYKSIINYQIEYVLEDGTIVRFKLKQTDFPHLIGLHKLIDIPVIRQFNDKNNTTVRAKYIISKIKQQQLLTEQTIKNSIYFTDIKDRFDNFTKENLLTVSYTDAIIDFDPTLIPSSLNAKYILFEQQKQSGYNHLCVAEGQNQEKYAESFFYNPTDLYIRNQQIIKVNEVRIYDNNGKLYFNDKLIK